jgi:apolipoprotein N-acyltransferase
MSHISTKKILYSILSGVMLTASFPPLNWDWIVWFALVPLLKVLEKEPPSAVFRLGFIAGLAHYLTLIYWIFHVLGTYGGLNIIVSAGILLLFCLYLSLYPAIFAVLFRYMGKTRLPILMAASIWVSLELIRAKFLTGFPWGLLGYSQHGNAVLIQIVDIIGVYGLSFIILSVNTLIYLLLFNSDFGSKWKSFGLEASVLIIFIAIIIGYGKYRLSEYETEASEMRPLRVAIVQGNIDLSIKWDPVYQKETMNKYHRLTRVSYGFNPELILWPETAVPFFFQEGSELSKEVIRISRESGAYLIFGSPAYKRNKTDVDYYNRIYLLSPQGVVAGKYDKVHLVPFGEYVPMKRFLPFVHRLVAAAGDFKSGKEVSPLRIPHCPAGGLICYEAIFPELSREHAKKGAKILVNLTNDAWFGMTSAPYQHLFISMFRAVETRRPLIRAANTGFSAFIDPRGEILSIGDLFNEEVLIKEIRVGGDKLTIYSKYGDFFAYLLLIICLIKFFRELCYHLFRR